MGWFAEQLRQEMQYMFGVTAVSFMARSHDLIRTFCHRRAWLRGRSSFLKDGTENLQEICGWRKGYTRIKNSADQTVIIFLEKHLIVFARTLLDLLN